MTNVTKVIARSAAEIKLKDSRTPDHLAEWRARRTLLRALSHEAMCNVSGYAYDIGGRTGWLYIGECECADMGGCIRIFKRIDPNVSRILIFAGEVLAFEYRFDGWKVWDHTSSRGASA